MCFPVSIATSSALIDFGRPTNSGITMCGNTTTSRNGSSGKGVSVVESVGRSLPMAVRCPSKSLSVAHYPSMVHQKDGRGKAKVGPTGGHVQADWPRASADQPCSRVAARQSRADA